MPCGHFVAVRRSFLVINGVRRWTRGSTWYITGSWIRLRWLRIVVPTISCFPFSMLAVMWGCGGYVSNRLFFKNGLMMTRLLSRINRLMILSCYSMGWGNDLRRGGCSCNRGQSTNLYTAVARKLPRCWIIDCVPTRKPLLNASCDIFLGFNGPFLLFQSIWLDIEGIREGWNWHNFRINFFISSILSKRHRANK